ncbi:hypothetical protein Vretimale_11401 [Volvox reticuliferus]|uniref:Uncharacterized protein n=1 Tax=Volvox reticuliferus TaxID=1737510 RepID=A0A8J4LQX9_9CHLO|nr:hypothetical protein Vretifemale_11921 [Volvox reticuliferus]GIM07294.1 hypothetical protein Vretimale_11401 [Volvox reticuliferus]
MGTDDEDCFGCLPWRRHRVSSARTTNSSVTKPLRPTTANNVKLRGILKTAPETPPTKWRSQVGASESSSTASVNGAASESGALATQTISATAIGPADEIPTVVVSPQARNRSALGPSQIRFASQVQIHPVISSFPIDSNNSHTATSCQTLTGATAAEAALCDPDVLVGNGTSAVAAPSSPQAAAAAAGGAWSSSEASSRLQDLQEHFRQRVARAGNGAATGAPTAPEAGGPGILDHLRNSDQMQCDSFTYCASVHGRRSSNGGRLGPLPPLSPSPARNGNNKSTPMGHTQSLAHSGGGATTGRQPHKRDQRLQQKAALSIYAPESSRGSITAHIPGSLPSMTQPQVSPVATRIYPPQQQAVAAVALDNAPPVAPALPSPTTPQPPRVSWSEMNVAPLAAAAAAAAVQQQQQASLIGNNLALWSGKSLGRQVDFDQHIVATDGGADGDGSGSESDGEAPGPNSCDVQGFSFSSHWSQAPSRFAGGGISVSASGAPLQRSPHGPEGKSTADAATAAAAAVVPAAVPGLALAGKQVLVKLPAGGSTGNNLHHQPGDPRQTPPNRLAQEGNGGGGGGGPTSLQLFDSFTPGGVPTRPPSLVPPALELRTAPGCMTSSSSPQLPPQLGEAAAADGCVRGMNSDLLSSPSPSSPSPPLPQHRFSLRLLPEQLQAPQGPREGSQQTEMPVKMAFSDAPRGAPSRRSLQLPQQEGGVTGGARGANIVGADIEAPAKAMTAAQQRMLAARANEEMLQALLGSSKRMLMTPPRVRVEWAPGG